jgi:hypothetical protein
MNGALSKGYSFKSNVEGFFKNYCDECKGKYE